MFNIEEKVEGIVKSYVGYIPAQFIDENKTPKARATIEFIIRVAVASAIFEQLAICFSMEEASGKTLDMIAENFGVTRNLPIASSGITFFQEPDYNETAPKYSGYTDYVGFTNYTSNANYESIFRRYSSTDTINVNPPDDVLKQIILFKVLANKCRGTIEDIISLLRASGLSDYVAVYDNGDRTITYNVNVYDSLMANIIYALNLFPRPMGIGSVLVQVVNPLGLFHFLGYGGNPLGFCFNAYGYAINGRTWLQYP